MVVPKLGLSNIVITEGGKPVWQNNRFVPGVSGISGAHSVGGNIEFNVGGGRYEFDVMGKQGMVRCAHAVETETVELVCPPDNHISQIGFASFGSSAIGSCGSMTKGYGGHTFVYT